MRRTKAIPLWTGVAAVAVGCGDSSTAPVAEPCTATTTSVSVSVSGEGTPVFEWEPACPLAVVLVEPPDTAQDTSDRWAVWTSEDTWDTPEQANLITPPVTYGVRPAGITQENGPEQLVAGRSYEIILWRILDAGVSTTGCVEAYGQACIVALQTFTR